MNITRPEFERLYLAELLPISSEALMVGDLWNWNYDLFFYHPHLVNLEQNIAQVLSQDKLLDKLKSVPLVNKMLPNVDFTADVKESAAIRIIALKGLNISAFVANSAIVQLSFEEILCKSMSKYRQKICTDLEKLKNNDFSVYKHHIQSNEIAFKLFFSNYVVLKIDLNNASTQTLKEHLKQQGIAFESAVDQYRKETFRISCFSYPFAAQFITGRNF